MNTQQCLQMLREIKDTAFATVDENGFPQIRMIDIMAKILYPYKYALFYNLGYLFVTFGCLQGF